VGQTIQDPNHRRLEHICDSKHNPPTYHFHNALKKYGVDAFTFEVIDSTSSLEELNLLEEKYVAQFDSIANGFNIRNAGNNKLHSTESKLRISESQKQAHAIRRANGTEGGWKRIDGGPMKGKTHPNKGGVKKESFSKGKKGWKMIDGKQVWFYKEASV
jgi:hypothetical protein